MASLQPSCQSGMTAPAPQAASSERLLRLLVGGVQSFERGVRWLLLRVLAVQQRRVWRVRHLSLCGCICKYQVGCVLIISFLFAADGATPTTDETAQPHPHHHQSITPTCFIDSHPHPHPHPHPQATAQTAAAYMLTVYIKFNTSTYQNINHQSHSHPDKLDQ